MDKDYPFVLKAYESDEKYQEAMKLALIIFASSCKNLVEKSKIIFRFFHTSGHVKICYKILKNT